MPRRRLIGEAGALLAWLVAAGCGSSSTPAAKPAAGLSSPASPVLASPAIEGVASPKPIQAQAPTAPSPAPVLTISPEAATITADDPGVQLLLRRQSADGTVKDLTGLAAWRVDPPGFGAIEAGGYLRPLAAGKVSVKAVFEGQEVAALINVEPRENRSWDFASDVVPILTPPGLQHRKLPWKSGRSERLSSFPFRIRSRRRLPEPGPGGRPAQGCAARSGTKPLPDQGNGRTPHGGGHRVAAAGAEYRLLLDWIKAGPAAKGQVTRRRVAVSIEPETIRLAEPGPQQLRVVIPARRRAQTRRDPAGALQSQQMTRRRQSAPMGGGELLRRAEADVIVRVPQFGARMAARLATVINPRLGI